MLHAHTAGRSGLACHAATLVSLAWLLPGCATGPAETPQATAPGRDPVLTNAGDDDPWPLLRDRYDLDGDGRVTPTEHGRGDAAFRFLDRDHDGVLTVADFDTLRVEAGAPLPAGLYVRLGGPLARTADIDDDAIVSRTDWNTLLDRLSVDGRIDREALDGLGLEANRVPMTIRVLDGDRDGALTRTELDALFARLDSDGDGRIAGVEFGIDDMARGPVVGNEAPDFDLPRVDDPARTVRLAAFRGERPVALIFGSYT